MSVEGEAQILNGVSVADGTVVEGDVEIGDAEGAGGTTYNDRLGFVRVDGEEPPVAPCGERGEVRLEQNLGSGKGGGKG